MYFHERCTRSSAPLTEMPDLGGMMLFLEVSLEVFELLNRRALLLPTFLRLLDPNACIINDVNRCQ